MPPLHWPRQGNALGRVMGGQMLLLGLLFLWITACPCVLAGPVNPSPAQVRAGASDVQPHTRMSRFTSARDPLPDAADEVLECEYTLVLEAERGGRLFTVAPTDPYEARFKAAVEADLTEAIFTNVTVKEGRETEEVPSRVLSSAVTGVSSRACDEHTIPGNLELSSASRASSLFATSCGMQTKDASGSGVENTTELVVRRARGLYFHKFFANTSDGSDVKVTCRPPGIPISATTSASQDSADASHGTTGSQSAHDANGNGDGDDDANNNVTVLEVRRRFHGKLPLIAVRFRVRTSLTQVSVTDAETENANSGDDKGSAAEDGSRDGEGDDAATEEASAERRGKQEGPDPDEEADDDDGHEEDDGDDMNATVLDGTFHIALPSFLFKKHVCDAFFYSLLRRHRLSRLSRDVVYAFPGLTIDAMEAIVEGKDSAAAAAATRDAATKAASGEGRGKNASLAEHREAPAEVSDVAPRSPSAAYPEGSQSRRDVDPLISRMDQTTTRSAATAATSETDAAATQARNALIVRLYDTDQQKSSCSGATCVVGIVSFGMIVGLVLGALMPFVLASCRRRRRERKDEARLLAHQQQQQQQQQRHR